MVCSSMLARQAGAYQLTAAFSGANLAAALVVVNDALVYLLCSCVLRYSLSLVCSCCSAAVQHSRLPDISALLVCCAVRRLVRLHLSPFMTVFSARLALPFHLLRGIVTD